MPLERWDPKYKENEPFSQLIIASRNSGKSYLTRYLLLYKLRDKFDMFVLFVNSYEERERYLEIVPTQLAFDEYRPEIIKGIGDANEKRKLQGKKQLNVLVLFDDTSGNKIKNDDQILQTYINGRHKNLSVIFITQSYSLANSTWRSNSDIIMLLRQNSSQARESVRKTMLDGSMYIEEGVNEKRFYNDLMRQFMSKTGDCLVIDYRNAGMDNLYNYRAPPDLE